MDLSAAELDALIDRSTPELATLARAALTHLREMLPNAVQLVYDNYNALVIGFGPSEKAGEHSKSPTLLSIPATVAHAF